MRIILSVLLVSTLLVGQSGCIPKKDVLKEHMSGSWDLTNHCYEYGFLVFDGDGSGTIQVNDECEVGYSCLNVLPFDWTVDEKTGVLNISYDPSGSALMICSSIEHTAPPAESLIVSKDTEMVVLYGYTFTKR